MFEEIRKSIAHFILRNRFIRKDGKPVSFKRIITDSIDILLVMPYDEHEFTLSLEVARYFQIHKKNITLFLPQFRQNQIHERDKYKFIPFMPDQVSRFYLPKGKLKEVLTGKSYDLILDLNRAENTFFSAISNIPVAKIRMGFRKNRSENYYNLLYDSKQANPDVAYFNLLNYLRMF